MGCLTGNYLILKGDLTSSEIIPLLIETYEFIAASRAKCPVPQRAIAVTSV